MGFVWWWQVPAGVKLASQRMHSDGGEHLCSPFWGTIQRCPLPDSTPTHTVCCMF